MRSLVVEQQHAVGRRLDRRQELRQPVLLVPRVAARARAARARCGSRARPRSRRRAAPACVCAPRSQSQQPLAAQRVDRRHQRDAAARRRAARRAHGAQPTHRRPARPARRRAAIGQRREHDAAAASPSCRTASGPTASLSRDLRPSDDSRRRARSRSSAQLHGLERLAQALDVHVDRALLDVHVVAPHLVEQLRAAVHALGMRACRKCSSRNSVGPSLHLACPADGHAMRRRVERERADLDALVSSASGARRRSTARMRASSSLRRERLGEVVVGPGVEARRPCRPRRRARSA